MATEKSPAVVALEQEQARQRSDRPESDLEGGLKDTFPASDPVSSTITAIPTGTADTHALASSAGEDDSPVVNEVLAAGSSDGGNELASSASQEIAALRLEIGRLKDSAMEIGEGSLRVAKARAEEVVEETRVRVRSRPFAAIGIAAVLGYVWGMTR